MRLYLSFLIFLFISFEGFSKIYFVTNTNNSGSGSLRKAIDDMNNSGDNSGNFIFFNISNPNDNTIILNEELPVIWKGVTIDARGFGSKPKIILRMNPANSPSGYGFTVETDAAVVIRGFVFQNFENGIYFGHPGWYNYGSKVECNYFGINLAGTAREYPLSGSGILMEDTDGYYQDLTIGGYHPNQRNVISGTGVAGSEPGESAGIFLHWISNSSVNIIGNYIGTDAFGNAAIGNGSPADPYPNLTSGIRVDDSWGNVRIEKNVISGNIGYGISLEDASSVSVYSNKIGTSENNLAALPNYGGISATYCSYIYIGDGEQQGRNIISGNQEDGISIFNGYYVSISGNYIGVNSNGQTASNMSNGAQGVFLDGNTYDYNYCILESNLIAGNKANGIKANVGYVHSNQFFRNSIFCNEGEGIMLAGDGADFYPAPDIDSAYTSIIGGTAPAYSTVEVFISDNSCSFGIQGKIFLGYANADDNGRWRITGSFPAGAKVTATASSYYSAYHTSPFSPEKPLINCTHISANAGADKIVCSTNPNIMLNGSVTGAAGMTWSSENWWGYTNNGTFTQPASASTQYQPGLDDIDSRMVYIYLTTTGNGICPPVRDTLVLTIESIPSEVSVGDEKNVFECGNTSGILLKGLVYDYSSQSADDIGVWTTLGTGTFAYIIDDWGDGFLKSDIFGRDTYYLPSSSDTSSGTVRLVYSSANTVCPNLTDTLTVTFLKTPYVEAGQDQFVCKFSSTGFQLNGVVSNSPGFTWSSSGSGTFLPNPFVLNAKYYPSQSDTTSGSVQLYLSAEPAFAGCNPVVDSLRMTFEGKAVVNAGQAQLRCQGDTAQLSGFAGNASSVNWTTNGTGTFLPNANSLNVSYLPSKADNGKIFITMTLNAQGEGTCLSSSSDAYLVIIPPPSPGVDTKIQVCEEEEVTLSGTTPSSGQMGLWTVIKGDGIISDPTSSTVVISGMSEKENIYRYTLSDTVNGCSNYAEHIVYKCYEPELIIYNAVSPNGDGMHDFLEIENIEAYVDNKVTILDRWGVVVFKIDNYDNRERVFKGFGNVDGEKELPEGAYYFIINKSGKSEKGFFVLRK
jgi:gliding motility-associated-like protein